MGSNRVSRGSHMERGEGGRKGGGGLRQRRREGRLRKEGGKAMNTLLSGG